MEDEEVNVFVAIIIGVVVVTAIVVAGWAYENYTFRIGGYCELALLGTSKTTWVKCSAESIGQKP